MRNYDEEISKYEQEAERIKAAFERCVGVIQYLKAKQKEEKEIKKEGK
tara:strand:- start:819 stop:962 length:144 start_codon:yes stop_codon:yes gene_type:complete